jgi:hypothetical protein
VLRKTIAAAAVASAALLGLAAPASAAPAVPAPQVKSVSPVVHILNGNTAIVRGVYKCSGNIQAHLWVSAKQGSTSGSTATAWFDTNYAFGPNDPDGITANCDGKTHSMWVTLHQNPFPGAPTASLKGLTKTYIQFCLVTDEANEIVASKAFWGHTGFSR